jgi:hypothetical protein
VTTNAMSAHPLEASPNATTHAMSGHPLESSPNVTTNAMSAHPLEASPNVTTHAMSARAKSRRAPRARAQRGAVRGTHPERSEGVLPEERTPALQ